jgi:tetratricopeptide (TPR) repeat protein
MIPTYPPLEAYRRDIARLAAAKAFGPDDGEWLAASLALQRYAHARPADRQRLAGELAAYLAVGNEITVCDAALRVTFAIEKSGALHLAASWLALLEQVIPADRPVELGRVLTARARLTRKFGDLTGSRAIYEEIERMGQMYAEPELTARAWIGYALTDQGRGNHPDSRRWFAAAALVADDNGCAQVSYHAHFGLQTAALIARDFDAAIREGWRAFALAGGDPELEAECLTNLSQVLYECGVYRTALRGFAACVAKASYVDTLVPALGGVASAAARLGRPNIVDAAAKRLEALLPVSSPLAIAQVLLEMSDANLILGRPEIARSFRERASVVAEAGGFHEFIYRIANPSVSADAGTARFELGPEANQIVLDIGRFNAPSDLCTVA